MAKRNGTWITLVVAMAASVVGCLGDGSGARGDNLQAGDPCSTLGQCAAGLECEIEHGVGVCRAHGGNGDGGSSSSSSGDAGSSSSGSAVQGAACATNADCAGGLECEIEHGVASCQPHGGDRTPSTDGGTGTTPTPSGCTTDADCPAGLECEIEHGVSYCAEHGGGRG